MVDTYFVFSRPADRDDPKQDAGDLDDFIFSGEEWHASER